MNVYLTLAREAPEEVPSKVNVERTKGDGSALFQLTCENLNGKGQAAREFFSFEGT